MTDEKQQRPMTMYALIFSRMVPFDCGAYNLNIGIFRITIKPNEGDWSARLEHATDMLVDDFPSLSEAIVWVETTARRIMRECFEIAGEMVVVQDRIAPDFIRVAPVKFSDEAK